jgi:hypothetical protein
MAGLDIDFGDSLNWIDELNGTARASADDKPAAETPLLQGAENVPDTAPATTASETPDRWPDARAHIDALEKDLNGFNEVAKGIGGLTGLQAAAPLLQGVYEPDPQARVTKVIEGLQTLLPEETFKAVGNHLLSGDQDALWALVDGNKDALIDHFIAEEGDKLRAKLGIAPAAASDDDDWSGEDDDDEPKVQTAQPDAEVEKLRQELAALKQQNAQLQGRDEAEEAKTRQVALIQAVETDAFGAVVNEAFGSLEGWEEADHLQALKMAQTFYAQDADAVAAFKSAAQFHGKPGYNVFVGNARDKWSQYLGQAITAVGAIRSAQQNKQASPSAQPPRPEINTAQSAPNTSMSADKDDPFANLAARVSQRLAAGG